MYSRPMVGGVLGMFIAAAAAQGQIEVTAPEDARIIVGVDPDETVFSLTNTGVATEFDATGTPATQILFLDDVIGVPQSQAGDTLEGGAISAGGAGSVFVTTGIFPGDAGDIATVSLTVTPDGGVATGASVNYRLVENRALTGNFTVDAGRHMVNQSIGTLTLSGGPWEDTHATRIDVNEGGYANIDNGFRLDAGTGVTTFNGADQTHDLVVARRYTGAYSHQFALPATHQYVQDGETLADFGGYTDGFNDRHQALLSAERLKGADLDLSGVTFDVQGTALEDRKLFADKPTVARIMQDGPVTSIEVDTTVNITTSGDDTHRTSLRLNSFDVIGDSIRAQLSTDHDFTKSGDAASVQVTGTITADKGGLGRKTHAVDAGSSIVTLENNGQGLTGETVQSSLPIAVDYHVLADNEAVANDAVVYKYQNASVVGRTFRNDSVRHQYGTDTHTDIGLDRTFTLESTSPTKITLTNQEGGGIVGEGLAGEVVQESLEYNVTVQHLQYANIGGTADGATLRDGDTLTLSNFGSSQWQNDARVTFYSSGDSLHRFGLLDLVFRPGPGGPPVFNLEPGDTLEWTVNFNENTLPPSAGLGTIYQAYLEAYIDEWYSGSLANAASILDEDGVGTGLILGGREGYVRSWTLEYITDATSDAGQQTYGPGTDFGDGGASLTSTRSTTASLIDSLALDQEITVGIAFADSSTATGDGAQHIVSDVVTLTGLDHVLHVLQLSFAPGTSASEIAWYYEDGEANGAWINAVLGNHNVDDLDLAEGTLKVDGVETTIDAYLAEMRFNGSYGSYLLGAGTPELGRFGVDSARGVVWAVIDHNSQFAGVPEPATAILVLGGMLLIAGGRKRGAHF